MARPRCGSRGGADRGRRCGLNNTDVNTRTGWYSKQVSDATGIGGGSGFDQAGSTDSTWSGAPLEFPRIQGADVCGRVVAAGEGGTARAHRAARSGRPVAARSRATDDISRATYFGSERDGGYADLVAVPAENAVVVESPLSDVELASFPTSSVTAANMLRRANLAAGETVLVTGASGGVGCALIGLALAAGATPIGVTSQAKAAGVRAVGAAHVIPRGSPDLGVALRGLVGSETVDVVADVVGGAGFPALLDVIRPGGRYTCSGAIAGPIVELDLRTMYLRDLTLVGATVPPHPAFRDLVRIIESGRLRPIVAATFPLERFRAAQSAFLEKHHVGNIVIDVASGRTGLTE